MLDTPDQPFLSPNFPDAGNAGFTATAAVLSILGVAEQAAAADLVTGVGNAIVMNIKSPSIVFHREVRQRPCLLCCLCTRHIERWCLFTCRVERWCLFTCHVERWCLFITSAWCLFACREVSATFISGCLSACPSTSHSRNHTLTHSHTLLITCTCCCDETKGTQDQHFACSFSDSLSSSLSPSVFSDSLSSSVLQKMILMRICLCAMSDSSHSHAHTLLITCTCCYDEIKGIQDQDFSCLFSDLLSSSVALSAIVSE